MPFPAYFSEYNIAHQAYRSVSISFFEKRLLMIWFYHPPFTKGLQQAFVMKRENPTTKYKCFCPIYSKFNALVQGKSVSGPGLFMDPLHLVPDQPQSIL